MNNTRRKALLALMSQIEQLVADLETLRDEEQEFFDAMPESLQSAARGEASQEALTNMEDALGNLESARDAIENAGAES
jgi:predicted RNase H-like HicB family nuclease